MPSVRVPGFLPSTSGLHFVNAFPHAPAVEIPLPNGQTLGIGDAANGLCGGMVFTVRDYFEAHRPPPPDTTLPTEGSPLFEYLVGRLIASFNLPLGIARYLELMDPLRPAAETLQSSHGLGLHSCGWIMVEQEWSKVQQDLDAGHPSPLGLVKVVSASTRDLGRNHQVLAYGYDLDGSDLKVWLYDPNYPDRDDVCLDVSLANPSAPTPVTYTPSSETVVCFFHNPYTPATPLS